MASLRYLIFIASKENSWQELKIAESASHLFGCSSYFGSEAQCVNVNHQD